ncbi:MAG: type I glyceraldehyde-3-phosphate dehydrogenase, partial [Candidatus Portnoybacteria bacterium]
MTKIAINGFGRIGRSTFRRIIENHPDLEVIAINDLADTKTLAHLLKYDSIYGPYNKKVDFKERSITVDGKEVKILGERDPSSLPWKDLGVDIVLECTGLFASTDKASQHLKAGAKKVIISAPCKDKTAHFVLGVNQDKYKGEEVISMASCTTNCLAPVAKVLNDNFEIESGLMTTMHSYTNDQRLQDSPHEDLRRARAAALSMIPTTTGAAIAVTKALPELEGRIDGMAIRVPTASVSLIDFVVKVKKETDVKGVNSAFKKASQEMKGILGVEDELLVSMDYKGNP